MEPLSPESQDYSSSSDTEVADIPLNIQNTPQESMNDESDTSTPKASFYSIWGMVSLIINSQIRRRRMLSPTHCQEYFIEVPISTPAYSRE